MAGQICKTCKHKNDWCYCSPNSICFDYEEDEDVVTKVEDFVRYAKDEYGCEITIEKSDSPDTFESILGECFLDDITEEEKMKDAMIRASNKAELTRQELFDVLVDYGLMAVYNLGMGHMYEYLKGEENG